MVSKRISKRLQDLPPYLFDELDKQKREALAAGLDVVDLGVGDPDLPTPSHIIDRVAQAAADPQHHRYPPYRGTVEMREAVAGYMDRRFGVSLKVSEEIVITGGSKEAIAHLPLAVTNPGDMVLVPEPGYPVYANFARFVGCDVHVMPLRKENKFLPKLEDIPSDVATKAALMWINYPNNPTGAVAPRRFYEEVSVFAETYDLVVASDAAYAEVVWDDADKVSALQVPSLRDRVIEFHSLSKTFNMTGWRVGFAVGAPWLVQALGTIKTHVDSGVFGAVQSAAAAALQGSFACVEELRSRYRTRRDVLLGGIAGAGLSWVPTGGSFFILVEVPAGEESLSFAKRLLKDKGILCTPCVGFGAAGEGFVRFSLTASDERIAEAAQRLRE